MPGFVLVIVVYLSAAILCVTCYWNVKKEKLGLVGVRGVIAAGPQDAKQDGMNGQDQD